MNQVTARWGRAACVLAALLLAACLKAPDDGDQLYSSYIVPADVTPPEFESDMAAAMKLDANDGFSGSMIPLRTGFANGEKVDFWDLGTLTATTVKPMWIFRRIERDGSEGPTGHPNLIDSIPGDTAYTPLRQLYKVMVTDAWDGERLTSLRALEDAIEFGLVEAPVPQSFFANCVVVLSTMMLQDNPEGDLRGPEPTFYRGKYVRQFCMQPGVPFMDGVTQFPLKDGQLTPASAYLLRRENEVTPLDEVAFKTDLDNDGDMVDSNVVFDTTVKEMGYNSIWKSYDVTVPRDYEFGTSTSEGDLFEDAAGGLAGKQGRVIQYKDNAVFLNRPIRWESP
jgi:hypothetical protein